MNGALWWLAQNTVTVGLAVVVVALLCRLTPNRPALHHLLWLIVMLKFLTPPVVVWPWSMEAIADRWRQPDDSPGAFAATPAALEAGTLRTIPADIAANEIGSEAGVTARDELRKMIQPRPRIDLESAIAEASLAATPLAPPVDVEGDTVSQIDRLSKPDGDHARWHWLTPSLFAIWVAGALLTAIWQARRLYRFHRLARRALPAPQPLADEVLVVAGRLGLRAPRACVSEGITTPLVWSLLRLVLLWPARLAGDVADQRGVIAHELAHVKRRDHWTAWLSLAAGCVWWWNPLFWLVRRRLHETAEMACDAIALELSPEGRGRYAELLLEWSQWSPQATPAPAVLGASFGARRTFRRRLAMILSDRVSSKLSWPGLALAGLLALASLPAWAWGQATEPASAADRAAKVPDEPTVAADAKKPASDAFADPRATTAPASAAASLTERLRQINAAGKALDEERAGRKAEEKVDVHQVAKDLQQARRDLRLIRTGGPIDAAKLAKAQRTLAHLRASMRDRKQTPETMVTETYLHMLSRRPSDAEARAFQKQLAAKPDSDEIYDDVFWGVLNSREFLQLDLAATDEPPTDASKPAAVNTPLTETKSLQDEVALLTAKLKAQEDKLRRVEAERAELMDQLKRLADRVYELQSTTKTRPASPPATRTTPRATDAPGTNKPDPFSPPGVPSKPGSKSDTRRSPPGSYNPFAPRTTPPADETAATPAADDPAEAAATLAGPTTTRRAAPASAGTRAAADGAVDVIHLATAYIDAQAAHDLAKARVERVEKLRGKGYVPQEQVETDLLTAATSARKLKLLRAIVEAEVAAAKAELDYVDRAIAEGVLPKSKRIGIEARLRVLGLIVEPEKSK